MPVPSIGTAAAMFWWPEMTAGKVVFAVTKVWLLVLPLAWRLRVDREPLSWSPARRGGFGTAVLSGVLLSGFIFAAHALATRMGAIDAAKVADQARKSGLSAPGVYLVGAVNWITLNSMLEEYVWRWFVFRKCETLWGGKVAVVAAALASTAHHVIALAAQFNHVMALSASLGVFTGDTAWTWLHLRHRSVWPGYASHALVDLAVFIIGYRLIFGHG